MADKKNPVNWFEIPVKDLKRAIRFYETVFGVKLHVEEVGSLQMAWFPMLDNAPGSAGSLVQGDGYTPSLQGTVVYFTSDDIEGTLARVKAKGGKTLLPKIDIGEYGYIAHFEDTEGNRIALHRRKEP